MNVMYLCDNNYAEIAGISVASMLENNKEIEIINIYLVEDGLTQENKNKISGLVEKYGINREITFISKPNLKELIGCKVETHWWIENVFSRVFLGKVFEKYENIERIIYIDCDTLVLDSLENMWKLDLQDHIGAGVREAMGNFHKKAIGLKKSDNYFNGGVFLIDLNKWKRENYDKKASDFIKSVNGKIEYADESVLNGILSKELICLSPRYNLTSLSMYFTIDEVKKFRKSKINESEAERKNAINNPCIVHFTSTFMDVRPWIEGSKNIFKEAWLYYKSLTPWKDVPLKKDTRKKSKIFASRLLVIIPKSLRLFISGFIHAYIKPMKYVIKAQRHEGTLYE